RMTAMSVAGRTGWSDDGIRHRSGGEELLKLRVGDRSAASRSVAVRAASPLPPKPLGGLRARARGCDPSRFRKREETTARGDVADLELERARRVLHRHEPVIALAVDFDVTHPLSADTFHFVDIQGVDANDRSGTEPLRPEGGFSPQHR